MTQTDEEFRKRKADLLKQESLQPEGWWWLSFCNPDLPTGSQFLGACIVRARGLLGACATAHFFSCNPGGEVQGLGPVPFGGKRDAVLRRWSNRLLSKTECETFDREMKENT